MSENKINNMIYKLNDKYIMLDSDLALLFGCSHGSKEINKIVRKNIRLFSNENYFRLSHTDYKKVVLQSESLEKSYSDYDSYLPYAFTEQAVYILSALVNTNKSFDLYVKLIDTFISNKRYLANNLILMSDMSINNVKSLKNIDVDLVGNNHKLFKEFDKLNITNFKNFIFYNGRIYEYYTLMSMLLINAEKDIVIVDEYVDTELLDIVNKLSVHVLIIVTKDNFEETNLSSNVTLKYNNLFSDRFILVDNKILYHLGSFKNNDSVKCFSINIIKEKELINSFRSKLYLS